jgi:hypothetical protein
MRHDSLDGLAQVLEAEHPADFRHDGSRQVRQHTGHGGL